MGIARKYYGLSILVIVLAAVFVYYYFPLPCGLESCHGLDIVCGAAVSEACTLEYKLGDRCRQYVDCEYTDERCMRVDELNSLGLSAFEACKVCADKCAVLYSSDPTGAFECESKCTGESPPPSDTYCGSDDDCACGVSVLTGDCFAGNRFYVDAGVQCPDFCTGIGGNLVTKCIDNECRQVPVPAFRELVE